MNKKPLYIQIDAHHKCNFNCSYCVSTKQKIKYPDIFDDHSKEEWLSFFASLKRDFIIMFGGGGEPVIDADVVDLIKRIHGFKQCIGIVIWTNGSLVKILNDFVSYPKIFFYVSFHKDCITLEKLEKNLKELTGHKKVAKVSYVVTEDTQEEELSRIDDFARKNDIGWFHVIADRRAASQRVFIDLLSKYHDKTSLDINLFKTKTRGIPCMAGKDYIFIDSSGNAWPCQSWIAVKQGRVGNIFDKKFKLRKLPVLCIFRQCNGCCQEYTQIVGLGLSSNIYGVSSYNTLLPYDVFRIMTSILFVVSPFRAMRYILYKLNGKFAKLKQK